MSNSDQNIDQESSGQDIHADNGNINVYSNHDDDDLHAESSIGNEVGRLLLSGSMTTNTDIRFNHRAVIIIIKEGQRWLCALLFLWE